MARPIITLTTDFGVGDSYVAQMKGVILGINPDVTIIDVSHDVAPQSIESALYVTQTGWDAFPSAIHVCVVDPGVGTNRRALVIETAAATFVGPDNGVLSAALPDDARTAGREDPSLAAVPADVRAFAITNETYTRQPASATFHGRDIFAPAAAHLSLGVSPGDFGGPVSEVLAFAPLRATRLDSGVLAARVVHVDHFGNVITDALAADLPQEFIATLRGRRRVTGPARTYAEAAGLSAIVGSSGYLEFALPGGDAAGNLNARIGDAVEIRETA